MNFIIEAAPELFLSLVFVVLLFLLAKEKLSTKTRHRILMVYAGGLITTLLLLYQSSTQPDNTLEVKENFAQIDKELVETKDLSPKTLTNEESGERLSKLIEEQKDSVSVDQDESDQ